MAQRVGRGIALLFHDRGTRVVSGTPQPHFTLEKDPVPILQEVGWIPGPDLKGGKSRLHRDSIPDRPARSQSLYRLSYPSMQPVVTVLNCLSGVKCCTGISALRYTNYCGFYTAALEPSGSTGCGPLPNNDRTPLSYSVYTLRFIEPRVMCWVCSITFAS